MKMPIRPRWVLLTGLAGCVVSFVYLDCARTLNLDLWRVPALQEGANQAQSKAWDLETRRRAELDARQRRTHVVGELVEDRLSLLEAAARFRTLPGGSDPNDYVEHVRTAYPADSPTESFCRYVIAMTRLYLENQPERLGLVGQLETELAGRVRCGLLPPQ
jgi:hypothetical protein